MGLNIDNLFVVTDKIRYDYPSSPLGGQANWAGTSAPYFTVSQELYALTTVADRIRWDELGLYTASQVEYDNFATALYAVSDVYPTDTRNFLDNLAILNGWIMVNVFPPANLLDTGLRTGLPISYNKLAIYALQHLRERRDTGLNADYDVNVFYNELTASTETQSNIRPPLFPQVVDGGLSFLNDITSFRVERPLNISYPNCDINDIGYCNHMNIESYNNIVDQLVAYQLTYSTSEDWAPEDNCGRALFAYKVMDNKFAVKYESYDEGIPVLERNSTPFVHLFNTNYIPTSGAITTDLDGYFVGTGFRNTSNVAPAVRFPKSQVGFAITASPVYAGAIDGFDIVKISIPNHRLRRGEPLEIVGLGLYDGFYTSMPYGDENTVAIRSIDQGIVVPNVASFLLLTDAYNWLAADPFELKDFLVDFRDITLDANGDGYDSSCVVLTPSPVTLANYVYKVYVGTGPAWPDYIDVNLFEDAILVAIKEFGGQNNYFNDKWIELSEQLDVTKDYFGFTDALVPQSVIRREQHELQVLLGDDSGLAEVSIALNGDFKHSFQINDFVLLENTGGTVDLATGYDGIFKVVRISDDTVTINAPYYITAIPDALSTIKLLAPFTYAGDLFNGVSLMLDSAFKALQNQTDIRTNNLTAIRDWISVGFFDNQQRLYESLAVLGGEIKAGFDLIDKRIKEEVLLTSDSLISIEDKSNEFGLKNDPELELNSLIYTIPDLKLVGLPAPTGSIHRVIHDKIPRGIASVYRLFSSISSGFATLSLVGPFAQLSQDRVKITDIDIAIGDDFRNVEESNRVSIVNTIAVRNIDESVTIVTSVTTDSLITESITTQELEDIHTNTIPRLYYEDDRLLAISSYIPMSTIKNLLNYNVTYKYLRALPTTIVYADSESTSKVSFEMILKATDINTDAVLDFNENIQYRIFGEHNNRYTDLSDIVSPDRTYWSRTDRDNLVLPEYPNYLDIPYSKYEYRQEDYTLIGSVAIEAKNVPADFFDNAPEMYGLLYKKIDVILYYESPLNPGEQIPIVTIPIFIYRVQKTTDIVIAYAKDIPFTHMLSDSTIEPTYTIVIGDGAEKNEKVIGKAEIALVDLINDTNRLITIGQYIQMLEADIGVPGKFNHNVGPFKGYLAGGKHFKIDTIDQANIVAAYQAGLLRRGQSFNVLYNGRLDPWFVYNDFPIGARARDIDIFAYIAPAIGDLYRGMREHNDIKKPYQQLTGLFNHINRFGNPHKDGSNKGINLTYE